MSLPVLSKAWQFDVNQVISGDGEDMERVSRLIYAVKSSLVERIGARPGVASPWTVRRSCNGVTASTDDLWVDAQSIIWGDDNTPHSWIILAQPGISPDTELCFDANHERLGVIWAPHGFDDNGTLTTRPTSPSEVAIDPDASENALSKALLRRVSIRGDQGQTAAELTSTSEEPDAIVHVMQSTDGECTRIVMCSMNQVGWVLLFDKPRNPVVNWPVPAVMLDSLEYSVLDYSKLQSTDTPLLRGYGVEPMKMYMSTESFGLPATAIGAQMLGPNDFDGNWPLTPIGVASLDAGQRGRHGELFDLWFGSVGANSGDTYPGDGTRQLVQFGHMVFPWDGTPQQPGSIPRLS